MGKFFHINGKNLEEWYRLQLSGFIDWTERKHAEEYMLDNGDTHKQLLARSRYLLFKTENKWTPKQRIRAEVLFNNYPNLQTAYKRPIHLKGIYENTKDKTVALTTLARWYEAVEQSGFKTFATVKRSISAHYRTILDYFDNRSTNASAESFNAKIKTFRATLRGIKHIPYFYSG